MLRAALSGLPFGINELEFRIKENKFRFVPIEIDAAEKHDLAPGTELSSLQIGAMKPLGMDETAAVGEDDVENASASPCLYDAAPVNPGVDSRILTDFQRG